MTRVRKVVAVTALIVFAVAMIPLSVMGEAQPTSCSCRITCCQGNPGESSCSCSGMGDNCLCSCDGCTARCICQAASQVSFL